MKSVCRIFVAATALVLACAAHAFALPPLQQAAADGNVDEVRRLVTQDPNSLLVRDEQGTIALHHAAWNGQTSVLEVLLKAGCPVDYPKRSPGQPLDGATALHHAAAAGQTEAVRLLLKYGAKVDAQDAELNTPLHHAAWNNKVEAATLLLDAGANPNARRNAKVVPLEEAAYFGHNDMARLLIARGAAVNVRVHEGNTPLHQAAKGGHWEMCQILVSNKADMETVDDDGRTPLHAAAQAGQRNTLLMLIAMGADPNAKDNQGRTPLAVAQGDTVGLLQAELKARSEAEAADLARATLNAKLKPGRKVTQTVVYQSRFKGSGPGPEWSTSATGPYVGEMELKPIPGTDKNYLGDFGTQAVRLSLSKLPPHSEVTVTVNVLAIFTWDGNGLAPGAGTDIWEASLGGGPTLFRTTFCTSSTPPNAKVPCQAFPGEWPRAFYPGGTGAIASHLLKRNVGPDAPEGSPDNVFRVSFTFAHDAPNLVLSFAGRGLEDLPNECWGLGSVEVKVGRVAVTPRKSARK